MGKFTEAATAVRNYIAAMPSMSSATVEIGWDEEVDRSAVPDRLIVVSPRSVEPRSAARNATVRELTIAVYYSAKAVTDTQKAACADEVESLLDRLESSAWQAAAPAGVSLSEIRVEFSNEENLREQGRYRAVLLATYKVAKGQF